MVPAAAYELSLCLARFGWVADVLR